MPDYSTLTVTTGTTITSAWGNAVRDSAVVTTLNASRPTSPHEGYVTAVTDKDRIEVSDGSGNWTRGHAWSVTGMTGGEGFCGVGTAANNTVTRLEMNVATADTDGNCNYSADTYTLPISGLWVITLHVVWATSLSASVDTFGRISIAGRGDYDVPLNDIGANGLVTMCRRLSSGEAISFHAFQNSGASVNYSSSTHWSCWMIPGSA